MATPWMFEEFTPVGVDLSSAAAVEGYDRNQGTDPAADDALLDRLGVGPGTRLVDLACGTGSFVVQSARRSAVATGVDVGERMLEFAGRRASDAGVDVALVRAGMLGYRHAGQPADVVTIKSALHQLPDSWKQAALLNVASFLRPGGLLYVWDLMFSFPAPDFERHVTDMIDDMGRTDGQGFSRADFEAHIREEYSTYTWILEGLLERAGFDVESTHFPRPTHGELVARLRATS